MNYRNQLLEAIQSVAFHAHGRFSWLGHPSLRSAAFPGKTLAPDIARTALWVALQNRLYNSFYCKGTAVSISPESQNGSDRNLDFVEKLSDANLGSGYWLSDCKLQEVRGDIWIVRTPQLLVRANRRAIRASSGGASQDRVDLRLPKEWRGISPGFYLACGEQDFGDHEQENTVRYYWNLAPAGALIFMQKITGRLNKLGMPFRLKAIDNPDQYTRCDAVVLYLRRTDITIAGEILEKVYSECNGFLRATVPALTKQLAHGLGCAESPPGNTSFGLHRCGVIAEGLIRAHERGHRSASSRALFVEEHFAEHGIDIIVPYLNPGSRDSYEFRSPRAIAEPVRTYPPPREPGVTREFFLTTAKQIGEILISEAIWHGQCCNWTGPIDHDLRQQKPPAYGSLGTDLYSGSAGVALFLAELFGATGNAEARRCAFGAAHHALSSVDQTPAADRQSLFGGWLGIAYASMRIGVLLGEEGLLESAHELANRAIREPQHDQACDIILGRAGAIVALLSLGAMMGRECYSAHAYRLGRDLLRTAKKSVHGYSWPSPMLRGRRHLTGFSHGAAGVGYALLELFCATGEEDFKRAADHAFAYERYWFDEKAGNWFDLRQPKFRVRHHQSFATFWCHGAPGIALSRVRAYELLGDATYRSEALAAIAATRGAVTEMLRNEGSNFSLCHGLAGNGDVLICAADVFKRQADEDRMLAFRIGEAGANTFPKSGHAWPCGIENVQAPGLMLGLAGIGMFYLRLGNPAIPSILLLKPSVPRSRPLSR